MKARPPLKAWLYFRQGGRCLLCGEPLDLQIPAWQYGSATFEHVVPKIRGGLERLENLALSHMECNHFRGNQLRLSLVRPPKAPPIPESGRRPLVALNGVWYSHFRLPVTDHRWDTAEQRERMIRRLANGSD